MKKYCIEQLHLGFTMNNHILRAINGILWHWGPLYPERQEHVYFPLVWMVQCPPLPHGEGKHRSSSLNNKTENIGKQIIPTRQLIYIYVLA